MFRSVYFLTLILLAFVAAGTPAAAQDQPETVTSEGAVTECGAVTSFDDPESFVQLDPKLDYCDIYGRRIAYREQNMRFSKQLNERRQYYQAPGNLARQNYREAMEILNEERSTNAQPSESAENTPVKPMAPAQTALSESEVRKAIAEQAAANTAMAGN